MSCLLHPPSALAIGIAMGIIFSVRAFCGRSKQKYLRMLGIYLVLAPLFVFETYMAVKKPPELGRMVSYKEALEMPEFSRDGGRFKMVPFWKPSEEIRVFAFQAFNSSLHKAPSFFENHTVEIVVFLAVLLVIFGMVRRKPSFRLECVAFLVAIFITYFCARLFAFYLFVPQRYIQIPMTVFFVASFPLAVWSVFRGKTDQRGSLTQYMGLVFLGVIVAVGSGSGLYGDANFNKVRTQKGHLWNWVRKYTPKNALIAGHPTHIDGVMLFGERRGYATTETAHPFYDKYYAKIKKRLEISLKAHYARSLKELALILKPEGVDYFIFKRKNFYPEALKKSRYFRPLDVLVRELTSRRYTDYAYKQLPRKVDMENAPYMPYRDDQSVVVDMRKLYQWLNAQGEKSSTPSVR
ncbi:MAG: hypothetical protein D6808_05930 [Candidatus Dadabacteria bacterium]|nr:MAG: hypothetical protein D6808_05930 [Candidatus Dadabacteria bacterium]